MNVFDIIGPVMIGPSSSHTAGAARLGKIASAIFGYPVKNVEITLYGSFSKTHKGHGTDRAIIGGLLGMSVHDPRIRDSFEIAKEEGLNYTFHLECGKELHPNTAKMKLMDTHGHETTVVGASVGGGVVMVTKINDLDVSFTCEYHTLIISHEDRAGVVGRVGQILAEGDVNIAQMRLFRHDKGGVAVMVLETDQPIETDTKHAIENMDEIRSIAVVKAMQ